MNRLFLGRTAPPCLAACDPDGGGELELANAVRSLEVKPSPVEGEEKPGAAGQTGE